MPVINLTSRTLPIRTGEGYLIFPPMAGTPPACYPTMEEIPIDGVMIHRMRYEVSGIPDPAPNTVYIVEYNIRMALRGRPDVVTTGPMSPAGYGYLWLELNCALLE